MDIIDVIFSDMEKPVREELKKCLKEYKENGDKDSKAGILRILGECNDRAKIRRFLDEL